MTVSMSTRIVLAVAEAKGTDPAALPPLHRTIDPEALDALFDPVLNGRRNNRAVCDLQFSYAGRTIRIRDGDITVEKMYRGRKNRPASGNVRQ